MTKPKRIKKFDGEFALSLTLMLTLGATLGVTARGLAPVHQQLVHQQQLSSAPPLLQSPTRLLSITSARARPQITPTQTPAVRIVRRFVQPPAATTRAS